MPFLKFASCFSDTLSMRPALRISILGVFFALLPISGWCGTSGTVASPAVEGGLRMFNGPNVATGTAGNLSGAKGYFLNFRAESRKDMFRLNAAAQFEMASGTAGVTAPSASDAFSMYGAAFLPGFFVYPFQAGRLQPFAGAAGLVGWYIMNLSNAYTQGLSFGYEVSAGVDLSSGGAGKIFRLRSAYASHSASLGGNTSGVSLSAFLVSLGVAY
jgi:hypothetical protein